MSRLENKAVLLIDDSAEIGVLVQRILQNVGVKFYQAFSVDEAIELLQKEHPHLIFLDLVMSGKHGFEFLKYRNGNLPLERIPVVVFSSKKDHTTMKQAMGLGANDYLEKPLVAAKLLQKLRKNLPDRFASLRYEFPVSSRPKVSCHIAGTITGINEAKIVVELPIKSSTEKVMKVESELLNECEVAGKQFKLIPQLTVSTQAGWFSNHLIFMGMEEQLAKKIRNVLQKWK